MTKKTNIILFAVLLLQVAVIAYIYRPGQVAGPPEIAFFAGTKAADISGLDITDEENNSIVLARRGDGWVISSDGNLPVNKAKLEALLDKLVALRSSRLVTRTKASHGRFKVEDGAFIRKIVIHLDDGSSHTLLLGTASNYNTVHVRADNADAVYLVNDLAAWEAPVAPDSWWESSYVQVNPARLTGLALKNGHGSFRLEKQEKGDWKLADSDTALSESAVQKLIDTAAGIRLTEYLGTTAQPAYGLKEPAATLALDSPGTAVTITVGARDATSGAFYVKSSASPFFVTVASATIEPLLAQRAHALFAAAARDPKQDEAE